jgi:hypothetical protein
MLGQRDQRLDSGRQHDLHGGEFGSRERARVRARADLLDNLQSTASEEGMLTLLPVYLDHIFSWGLLELR